MFLKYTVNSNQTREFKLMWVLNLLTYQTTKEWYKKKGKEEKEQNIDDSFPMI